MEEVKAEKDEMEVEFNLILDSKIKEHQEAMAQTTAKLVEALKKTSEIESDK